MSTPARSRAVPGLARCPVLLLSMLLASVGSAPAQGPVPAPAADAAVASSAHYDYFDESVPLDLETGRLAVLFSEDRSFTRASRTSAILRSGVGASECRDVGVPGWAHVELSDPVKDQEDADTRVARLSGLPGVSFASPVFRTPLGGSVIPTPVILVRFRENARRRARSILDAGIPGHDIVQPDRTVMTGYYKVRSPARTGMEVLEQANRLAERPDVAWAEPDMVFTGEGAFVPNDPLFQGQWSKRNQGGAFGGVKDIDLAADVAWEITRGDPGIKVLILDTGVQQDHPDLSQLPGMDFTSEGGDGGPNNACDNHGTEVAGCIAATIDNGVDIAGLCSDVGVMSARCYIADVPCSGHWTAMYSWTADALLWALDNGFRVTNNSNGFGGTSSVVTAAYQTTRDHGMIHFASAGNASSFTSTYPGSLSTVNALSAVDANGNLASFSNYGPLISYSAPGVNILTTDRTGSDGNGAGDTITASGTSSASPHAAGVAALALSMNPARGPDRVDRILRITARDLGAVGKDDDFGWGFLNANSAIRFPLRRTSYRSNGTEGDGASTAAAASAGGRFVAFASDATNLGGTTNGVTDVFVHDLDTSRTKEVSLDSSAQEGDGPSTDPDISADGRFVSFSSDATNLVAGDSNLVTDVFRRDRDPDGNGVLDENGDVTIRVSVDAGSAEAVGGPSSESSISGDGNVIAFSSDATNLVGSDMNSATDVFVRDVAGSTTTRVSVSSAGAEGDGPSRSPAVSADGNAVVFESDATNLATGDLNTATDVFLRDIGAGTTELVSVDTGGTDADGPSGEPSVSGDGRYVAFSSTATDLVAGDGNGTMDVFVRDRTAATTVRVSVTSAGGELTGTSSHPSISDDGQLVAFQSDAPELDGSGGVMRAYVHDLGTGVTMLVSRKDLDSMGTGLAPRIAPDGTAAVFESDDASLAPADGNGVRDTFVFSDLPCAPPVVTTDPADAVPLAGTPVTFSVVVSGTEGLLQWRKDGMAIAGAIGTSFSIDAATVSDEGSYDCVIRNYCGSDTSGAASLSLDPTDAPAVAASLPDRLTMEPAAPSPFATSTSVRFGLAAAGRVVATVYDVTGRRVATLLDDERPAGWYRAVWRGVSDRGVPVASGVYFLRIQGGGRAVQAKVIKIR